MNLEQVRDYLIGQRIVEIETRILSNESNAVPSIFTIILENGTTILFTSALIINVPKEKEDKNGNIE